MAEATPDPRSPSWRTHEARPAGNRDRNREPGCGARPIRGCREARDPRRPGGQQQLGRTADLVDPRTFKRVERVNVIPDAEERVAEIMADPTATFYFNNIRTLVGEGHNQYVDDGFTSTDGKFVYFSRPSFADAVAINLKSERIVWRTHIDGYRADHMAISQNGRRLLVSASTANVIDVIDTRTGAIVGRVPSGDSPHENNFSEDGKLIFHASIGFVYTSPTTLADATKGTRVFEVIDARTLQVLRTIDMSQKLAEAGYPGMSSAVRPMAISPSERYVYFQVSFFFGIVKYDLKQDRVTDVLDLPLADAEGLPRTEFLLDSATTASRSIPTGRSSASPERCRAMRPS